MKSKWTVLAFLCGIFFTYTVGRALLGLLAIPIQESFGISGIRFGILNSAVFWTYAAIVPFAGALGDRLDRRRLIGVAVVAWSAMTVMAGLACGFWSLLLVVSIGITVPQTLYGPSANALIAANHRETRTVALSLHQAAFYAGWFASGGAAALCLSFFGSWRSAYFIFGAIGLAAGTAFLLWGRRGDNPVAVQAQPAPKPSLRKALRAFFGCPSTLLAASGYVAVVFVGFGYSAWGPKFVAQKFGMDPAIAGTGVMFWHFAAAFVAILAAGFFTDVCVRRWPRFRLAVQSSVLFAAAPILAVFGFGNSVSVVFAAAAAFGVMRGLFEANAFASIFDVVGPQYRATAVGMLNVLAGTFGSLAPIALGALSDRMGVRGFEFGFAALGGVFLFASGLLALSFFVTFNRDRVKEES